MATDPTWSIQREADSTQLIAGDAKRSARRRTQSRTGLPLRPCVCWASKRRVTKRGSRCTTATAASSPTRSTVRSRCTPTTAASCPELASRDHVRKTVPLLTDMLGARRHRPARPRRDRLHGRAGPHRRVDGRRQHRPVARVVARHPGDRRASHGGAPARAAARQPAARSCRSLRCWCPADTRNWCGSMRSAATTSSANRSTTRPVKRSTRPQRCSASATPAVPPLRGWRSAAIPRDSDFHVR